jgi:hypothetical protein
MNSFVPIALYGWVLVVLLFFSLLPPRRAMIAAFLGGWLLLPEASLPMAGLPDISKISVTSASVLLGILLTDAQRVTAFRPQWIDLPMAAWCFVPMASSVVNGLGVYDGLSFVLTAVLTWGVPYLVGRLYFNDLESMRDLALGIVIAGVVYAPLCLLEVRLSPQLHRWAYGYHPAAFAMTYRWGGYRPVVFLSHGLMLGMWMASATLVAFWLWTRGSVRAIAYMPMALITGGLAITTVLCRSTGAVLLLAAGAGGLMINRYTRSGLLVALTLSLTPLYMYARANGAWDATAVVSLIGSVNQERADSLAFRIANESLIIDRSRQKKWLGWGGWGRWRVTDDEGRDITTSDGLWIIALGRHGLVGLAAYMSVLLLPVLLLLRTIPARHWHVASLAPVAAMAVLLLMFSIDCLFNAMPSPIFMMIAGGIGSFCLAWPTLARRYAIAEITRRRAVIARAIEPVS